MGMESIFKLSVLVNMIDRFTAPSARIYKSVGETSSRFQKYSADMAKMATDGAVLIGTGHQLAEAMLAPVKSTFATKDALAELGSVGVRNLGMLENAAMDFSSTWAGTTKASFISAAYDIKSGIANLTDEGVAEYTKIAGMTAKGTKATTEQMTSLFATGYGIYKGFYDDLSDIQFAEMFSGGIAQAVKQFKTNGAEMASAISALGASATSANVPFEEQLSILGMLQATMGGSEAGTKYTAFLSSAGRAGKELGLNFTDTNGQLKSMPEILSAIQGKFGGLLTASDKLDLQQAFGTIEAVKLIELLYGKTDDLQSNILTLYDTMGKGMQITEEMANTINAPPGQQWELFHQRMQGISETVGNAMLPRFLEMQDGIMGLAEKFAQFTELHPELISNIMYVFMAFGGFLSVLGILKLVVGLIGTLGMGLSKLITFSDLAFSALKYGAFLAQYGMYNLKGALAPLGSGFITMAGHVKTATIGMLSWVKQGILSAVSALPGLIASVWGFTTALLANPITWIVMGIIVLVGALYLLWQKWDVVSQFLSGVWQGVCTGVGESFQWLKDKVMSFIGWLGGTSTSFKEFGAGMLTSITDGILSVASSPLNAVKGALGGIRELLPFSDAKTGPLSDLTLSGQRVFTTFNEGMLTTAGLPVNTMEDSFAGFEGGFDWQGGGMTLGGSAPVTKQTTIQQLTLQVDLSSIEDMKKLKALIAEIEDETNSNPEDQEDVA